MFRVNNILLRREKKKDWAIYMCTEIGDGRKERKSGAISKARCNTFFFNYLYVHVISWHAQFNFFSDALLKCENLEKQEI